MNTTVKIIALAVTLAAASPRDLYAGTAPPTLLSPSTAKISAANDPAYDSLLKSRWAESILPVNVNAEAIDENTDILSMGLAGMDRIHKFKAEKTADGSIHWQGTFGRPIYGNNRLMQKLTGLSPYDPANFVRITRHNEALVGVLQYNGETYSLTPTSNGHAFVKIRRGHASTCDSEQGFAGPMLRPQPGVERMARMPSAKVLTTYTARVYFAVPEDTWTALGGTHDKVTAKINSIIKYANDAFYNSSAPDVKLESAGYMRMTNYTSTTASGDRTAISSSDAFAAYRQNRINAKSDIGGVLGKNYTGGIANYNAATAAGATFAAGYFSDSVIVHEIGHLYGAGHQAGATGTHTAATYSYAYRHPSSPNHETIMYTPVTIGRVVQYFSTPLSVYPLNGTNYSVGTSTQNNSMVIRISASRIANLQQ
jgi:hypothetical protein